MDVVDEVNTDTVITIKRADDVLSFGKKCQIFLTLIFAQEANVPFPLDNQTQSKIFLRIRLSLDPYCISTVHRMFAKFREYCRTIDLVRYIGRGANGTRGRRVARQQEGRHEVRWAGTSL